MILLRFSNDLATLFQRVADPVRYFRYFCGALRRLLPMGPSVPVTCVSRICSGLDLHLRVVERCHCTGELLLSY